jgi:hypothetical protein
MVIRDLEDGRSIICIQENRADLSAQPTAHRGNDRFAKPCPYPSMIFAMTYHDSGYREWEGTHRVSGK